MSDDLSIPNPGYRGNQTGRYGTGQNRIRPGMDPDTRRLIIFAGSLGAVLLVLIGASALIGHRSTEVPVIAADPRPIKVRPENPGGMKIDGAENDVFSGGSDTINARLAPPAESPDAGALRPAAAGARAGAAVDLTPVPPPAIFAPAVPMPPVLATPVPAAPAIVPAAPAAMTSSATGKAAAANTPTMKAANTATATPAKPQAPAAAVSHPAASGQHATVQLAALTSEEAARDEWQRLSKRMPDLMNGHQPVFSRVDREGRTFWRVRTSGFVDVSQARAFCDNVRAKGGGCTVAEF